MSRDTAVVQLGYLTRAITILEIKRMGGLIKSKCFIERFGKLNCQNLMSILTVH